MGLDNIYELERNGSIILMDCVRIRVVSYVREIRRRL
jgi:hypothetical protein